MVQRPEPTAESRSVRVRETTGAPETNGAPERHATEPVQAPSPPPAAEQARTTVGLPRRVPRASLAAQIAAAPPARDGLQAPEAQGRQRLSPDNTGSLLARYRTGLQRGRTETGLHQDSASSPRGDDGHVTE